MTDLSPVIKLIKARVRPGRRLEFLEQQRVWNDAMSAQAGFLGVQVALDPREPDTVYILMFMASRAALDRFMAGDHDAVLDQTDMSALYESLDIRVLDVVEPGPPALRLEVSPSRTGSGYQVALLSELYRVSAVLRTAVELGLFDAVGDAGAELSELATRLELERAALERVVGALGAVQLVALDGARVRLTRLARQHLRRESPGYLGDLVLHNTRPALWERWGGLTQLLTGATPAPTDEHTLFLRAMRGAAGAGQADALLQVVDLSQRRRLLDVGGALGDYSIALCRAYPELSCVVLEQPASAPATRGAIVEALLSDRIAVATGDYRRDLDLGPPFDAVLLSNVLRGETPSDAEALLRRLHAALQPGGLLILPDLFPDDPPARGPLIAALFGLHLPLAMNGSVIAVRQLLAQTGFEVLATLPLDGYLISNRVILAQRPR